MVCAQIGATYGPFLLTFGFTLLCRSRSRGSCRGLPAPRPPLKARPPDRPLLRRTQRVCSPPCQVSFWHNTYCPTAPATFPCIRLGCTSRWIFGLILNPFFHAALVYLYVDWFELLCSLDLQVKHFAMLNPNPRCHLTLIHAAVVTDAFTAGCRVSILLQCQTNHFTLIHAAVVPDAPSAGCRVCWTDKDQQRSLLCDNCDDEVHCYCLDPPLLEVPEGEWHCPVCSGGQRQRAGAASASDFRVYN